VVPPGNWRTARKGDAVGRLDDLGGLPDCLVPDSGIGVGEGSFGGVEPCGDQGAPLDGDGGAPALVGVANGEDAVFVASLGKGVLNFPEEFRQPGRRDRLAQGGSDRAGMGIKGSSPCGYSAVIPARLLSVPVSE
jgi:hypothetical protein